MQSPLEHPEQDYRFDPLRLRFRNPAFEQKFIRETLAASLNFVRSYLIAGTGLYICFGLLDWFVGGDQTITLWAIRYGVVVPRSRSSRCSCAWRSPRSRLPCSHPAPASW